MQHSTVQTHCFIESRFRKRSVHKFVERGAEVREGGVKGSPVGTIDCRIKRYGFVLGRSESDTALQVGEKVVP
jgi:hypothetical protein